MRTGRERRSEKGEGLKMELKAAVGADSVSLHLLLQLRIRIRTFPFRLVWASLNHTDGGVVCLALLERGYQRYCVL
jgi:hypothetical protein